MLLRGLWGKQGNGETRDTGLKVKESYSSGWEQLLKNVVSQTRNCSGCEKGRHQQISTSCWRTPHQPVHSSLNISSLSLDHFSDIIPHLEPDATFQQDCASWQQRGDCSVPTRDRHRAVRWRCSGKLKILLSKKPGLLHLTAGVKAKLCHWIGMNGWPCWMELSVTVVCSSTSENSPETHFTSLQSCGLVFSQVNLAPKDWLREIRSILPPPPLLTTINTVSKSGETWIYLWPCKLWHSLTGWV